MSVRRAPVASSIAGFAAVGLAAMSLWSVRPQPVATVVKAIPRDSLARIEMLATDGRVLWSIPSSNFVPGLMGQTRGLKYVKIVDLDQDGSNEVLTVMPPGDGLDVNNAVVRAFRSDGTELWRWQLGGTVTVYDSTRFFSDWKPRSIEVYQEHATGRWRVIAGFVHQHSPAFIVRLDDRGKELGQWWTYGHTNALVARDLNGDGAAEVITYGHDDQTGGAHITVLDPDRINGISRSVRSPGYSLPAGTAELRITMVPSLPISREYSMRLAFFNIFAGDAREVALAWGMTDGKSHEYATFVVDSTLEVVSVTPSDGYVDFANKNARWRPDLQTKRGLSKWFLDNLKVWNGQRWAARSD